VKSSPAVRSPLHNTHERLGGRFVTFSGWLLPLQYQGTLAEHRAVRGSCGVFDVSHLGRFWIEGDGATDTLQRHLCNDVARIEPGRAQYTMMLNPEGGIIDDIIVWRCAEEQYWVLPNAANYERVFTKITGDAPGLEAEKRRESTALIAVQGPKAPRVLEEVLGWRPQRFHVDHLDFGGAELIAAGTGYTGEAGGEVVVSNDTAQLFYEAVIEAGAVPCGLGARDTLRLEMGYPLWGDDLDENTTPLEAGFDWVVSWDHGFTGKEALEAQRKDGLPKRLIGFAFTDRSIPRHGYALRCGQSTGTVASGNFSPTLEVGIGMGYVAPDPGDETGVEVEIRGRFLSAKRVTPPFVER
jgi:aminomethyltransferase